jgi:hypothetical protein
MQDREIPCIYYKWEGECAKGREGTFRDACQTCKKYKPKKGAVPAKRNLKKQKLNKINEKDINDMMKDY